MDIKIDNEVLITISDEMIKLYSDHCENPIDDIKRRLKWVIEHNCDVIYKNMVEEWKPILEKDDTIEALPKSKLEMINLITSRKEYKTKKERNRLDREAGLIP